MPQSPPPAIDVLAHTRWARGIARGVRADYGFRAGSQEELELEAEANLVLVQYAARFDPARVAPGSTAAALFENWAAVEVRSRCRRLARRLLNGGTYHTTADKAAHGMRVGALPERCANCYDVQFGDGDGADEDDVNGWLAAHGYT